MLYPLNLILAIWLVSKYSYHSTREVHAVERGLTTAASPLHGYINHIILNYQDLIQDEVIPYQTMSWNFVKGYESVDEQEMGACPPIFPNGKKQQEQLLRSVSDPLKHISSRILASASNKDFIWDDEEDIGGYFDTLRSNCKQEAFGDEFGSQCWGFLKDLIYAPRCTTRVDSRKVCKRGDSTPARKQDLLKDLVLGQRHFRQDSVNIVIIGAGPVGLFLANALTELDQRHNADHSAWHPKITVTILENRVERQGIKLPYNRNWQTIPDISEFIDVVDARVSSFFNSISNNDMFAMPLNAIEALLYLSNRDRGVKFVFDAKYEKSLPLLAKKVPNLLVFDATGHRLDTLVRGNNCQKSNDEETVEQWQPRANHWDWFGGMTLRVLHHYQHVIDIAQKGDLMYPVNSNGLPYSSWWLHIHDIPHEQNSYDLHGFWERTPASSNSKLCIACIDLGAANGLGGDTCKTFCKTNGFFSSLSSFRQDIQEFNLADEKKQENRTVWFAKRGANINLTGKQAQEIRKIIHAYGYNKAPVGMPLKEFPFEEMSTMWSFQLNGVLDAMIGISKLATTDQPTITLFQHRPYAYNNALSDSSPFKDVPLLRIGDSLLTGDPNRSSGLLTHFWVIRSLMCRIRGEEDDCHHITETMTNATKESGEGGRLTRFSRF